MCLPDRRDTRRHVSPLRIGVWTLETRSESCVWDLDFIKEFEAQAGVERADGGGARAGLAARAASDAGGGGYAAS